jgi:hypothetical protein
MEDTADVLKRHQRKERTTQGLGGAPNGRRYLSQAIAVRRRVRICHFNDQ